MANDEVTLAMISSQVAGLGDQMAALASRVRNIETAMRNIETAMNIVLQDGRKLHALGAEHTRMFTDMHRDVRMTRAAINDFARENVTPGEIASIHTDLDRHQATLIDLAARVGALETPVT